MEGGGEKEDNGGNLPHTPKQRHGLWRGRFGMAGGGRGRMVMTWKREGCIVLCASAKQKQCLPPLAPCFKRGLLSGRGSKVMPADKSASEWVSEWVSDWFLLLFSCPFRERERKRERRRHWASSAKDIWLRVFVEGERETHTHTRWFPGWEVEAILLLLLPRKIAVSRIPAEGGRRRRPRRHGRKSFPQPGSTHVWYVALLFRQFIWTIAKRKKFPSNTEMHSLNSSSSNNTSSSRQAERIEFVWHVTCGRWWRRHFRHHKTPPLPLSRSC